MARTHSGLLHLRDLVLFSISAVVVVETIGATAALGVQGLTLWCVVAILFLVPYCLVSAELGSGWPGDGGLYVWLREAFGPYPAAVSGWLYWINIAFWLPSIFLIVVGVISAWSNRGVPATVEAPLVLLCIWVCIGLAVLDVRWSRIVTNVAALTKIGLILGLAVLAIVQLSTEGPQVSLSAGEWVPKWGDHLSFLPAMVFSLIGFELTASLGNHVRDPARDVPRAIAISGVLTVVLYVLATGSVLVLLGSEDASIVTAIVDAGGAVDRGGVAGKLIGLVMAAAMVVTLIGTALNWILGTSLTISAAGIDHGHRLFSRRHPTYGTPDFALYTLGGLASVMTLVNYGLFSSRDQVFWSIFAVSSVVSLLPYLLMFPAAVQLRRSRPAVMRTFVIPGGMPGVVTAALTGEAVIIGTLVLLVVQVPEGIPAARYLLVVAGGTLLSVSAGLWLYRRVATRSASRPVIGEAGSQGANVFGIRPPERALRPQKVVDAGVPSAPMAPALLYPRLRQQRGARPDVIARPTPIGPRLAVVDTSADQPTAEQRRLLERISRLSPESRQLLLGVLAMLDSLEDDIRRSDGPRDRRQDRAA